MHLAPFFGHLRPANVSTDLINRYIDKRQGEGASNASVNRELALLKCAFNLGRHSTPPKVQNLPHFEMLKESKPRRGFLETSQYDALVRECGKCGLWMRTIFELGFSYGWRHGEILSTPVSHVRAGQQSPTFAELGPTSQATREFRS